MQEGFGIGEYRRFSFGLILAFSPLDQPAQWVVLVRSCLSLAVWDCESSFPVYSSLPVISQSQKPYLGPRPSWLYLSKNLRSADMTNASGVTSRRLARLVPACCVRFSPVPAPLRTANCSWRNFTQRQPNVNPTEPNDVGLVLGTASGVRDIASVFEPVG